MTTKVRIRITLVVDIDREAYDAEYGAHATLRDIRDHVEGVAQSSTQDGLPLDADAFSVSVAQR